MLTDHEELANALAAAHAEIAAAAPDAATAAEGDAYLMRVLSANLADAFLGHLLTDNGLSRPLPVKGAPNPDYLMRHARVEPDGRYRLDGRLNGSERVGAGLYSFDARGAALLSDYAAFDPTSTAEDGTFSLTIAPDAGDGGLTLKPDCRVLLVRILHRDPDSDPARLSLAGGADTPDLTLAGGTPEAGIGLAARMALGGVRQFLEWSRLTSERPNIFMEPPEAIAASAQGDPDTCYLLGYYRLGDGEHLEVVLEPPAGYWSLHAYNHWGEPLPGAGVHDLNVTAEPNGRVRVAIRPEPPTGAPNPIRTLGRQRGMLIFRAVGGEPPALPEAAVRK